jgi:hypothetical protein
MFITFLRNICKLDASSNSKDLVTLLPLSLKRNVERKLIFRITAVGTTKANAEVIYYQFLLFKILAEILSILFLR